MWKSKRVAEVDWVVGWRVLHDMLSRWGWTVKSEWSLHRLSWWLPMINDDHDDREAENPKEQVIERSSSPGSLGNLWDSNSNPTRRFPSSRLPFFLSRLLAFPLPLVMMKKKKLWTQEGTELLYTPILFFLSHHYHHYTLHHFILETSGSTELRR